MKFIKVPTELTEAPYYQRALQFNGFSSIETGTHEKSTRGVMFLEEHLLMYVIQGQNILKHGKAAYAVRKNEMILLPKATLLEFEKSGDPEKNYGYDSLLFFFKDEFLQEFIRMANIKNIATKEVVSTTVKPVNQRMKKFFESIIPYFNEPVEIDQGLVKIKMLELLFDLAATDKELLQQLLQMKRPVKTNLAEVMEANFSNPVNIEQLAYLSGRSLASFKRDFNSMYNIPPSEWIRLKRLTKAMDALENTSLPVADICYMVGFENPSHFSRIFKAHFGHSPASLRHTASN